MVVNLTTAYTVGSLSFCVRSVFAYVHGVRPVFVTVETWRATKKKLL